MTPSPVPATVPGPPGDPGARQGRFAVSALRRARTLAGVLPFAVYVVLGLGVPAVAIAVGAFQNSGNGSFTLSNIKTATHGVYLHGFETTLVVAGITAIVPGIVGFLVAYAIFTARRGAVLRRAVITASGVFANFGGVPLAFLFIATLGTTGLATGADLGRGLAAGAGRHVGLPAGDLDDRGQAVAPGRRSRGVAVLCGPTSDGALTTGCIREGLDVDEGCQRQEQQQPRRGVWELLRSQCPPAEPVPVDRLPANRTCN